MRSEERIRAAAFAAVKSLTVNYGGAIPWTAINRGFVIDRQRVHLASRPRGIFKPRQLTNGVLSIKTTIPRTGRLRTYDDIASDDGYFDYKFQGTNPKSPDNQGLREAWEQKLPLIYFHGIAPSLYQAIYPVFVTAWLPEKLSIHLVPGLAGQEVSGPPRSEDQRRYAVIQSKIRLHQSVFRELVLDAYDGTCAVSGIAERRLVQAAHVLPDRDVRGQPVISNGIAMSVLHHAAYDRNLLGIDPDGVIHIKPALLAVQGGRVFREAFQKLDQQRIRLPADQMALPNWEFIEERFREFKRAG